MAPHRVLHPSAPPRLRRLRHDKVRPAVQGHKLCCQKWSIPVPPAGRCSQSLPGLVRPGRGMTKPPAGAEGCSSRLLYPAGGKRLTDFLRCPQEIGNLMQHLPLAGIKPDRARVALHQQRHISPAWDTSWRGVPGLPRPLRAGLRHWSSCHPSRAAQAVMRRHRHRPSRSSALHISRTRVSLPRHSGIVVPIRQRTEGGGCAT